MQAIEDICRSLGNRHGETMQKYGEDNHLRMTGAYETASFNQFTFGVANRGCSIRIPRNVAAKGYGYLEDRRPASNADPYNIYSILTNADADADAVADVAAVAEAQVETTSSSSD
jgi:glutamine synthetase